MGTYVYPRPSISTAKLPRQLHALKLGGISRNLQNDRDKKEMDEMAKGKQMPGALVSHTLLVSNDASSVVACRMLLY